MARYTFPTPEAAMRHQRAKEREFVRKVIYPAQLKSAHATLRRVVMKSPRDRGEYALGWEVKPIPGRVPGVNLENNAPHAGIIELGARPFWPPIGPLIEWARRKARDLGLDTESDIKGFAYAVQRAIARRGLPPRYIMRNQIPFAVVALRRATEAGIRRYSEQR
jgi:hypothetical protein